MQVRPVFICTCLSLISFCLNAQKAVINDTDSYPFSTTLKGGYSIFFKTDDSLQYLYLKKNGKIIKELSTTSNGLPYKNLGYIGADFTNYFVLVHSYGSGNPHYIELIKKSTGQNQLYKGAAWIDVDENKEILFFCRVSVPKENDKMILQNIKTGKREYFDFPEDIFGDAEILNRIQIKKLTDKQLIIEYEAKGNIRTKAYDR